MITELKKAYSKYFQKSKSFLAPVLGLRKHNPYPCIQSYMKWQDKYELEDYKLTLTYENESDKAWSNYLLKTLMTNRMFDEYHYDEESDLIAISFDLHSIREDYDYVIQGKYSELSKSTKTKIREFYGYNSPEWAYMESFLFPDRYIPTYSKILDVDEEHIRFTGQLCDLPDLNKETLKLKPYAKINDVDQINMESREDLQADPN